MIPEDPESQSDEAPAEEKAPEEEAPEEEAPEEEAPGEEAPGDLPDAPLFALLRTIEAEIGPEAIDRLWVFPPRRLKAGETAVAVVGAYHETDDDRRRVVAAHYTAPAEASEARLALDEYGTAPADRVGRLVEDVVERIKDDAPPQPPKTYRIERDSGRWHEMIHELAEKYLAEVESNPRLRH